MMLQVIRAYIDPAAGSQNDANVTGVHCIYSDMPSKVVLQNYGRAWSVVKFRKFAQGELCA